jgi:hypothetical protein
MAVQEWWLHWDIAPVHSAASVVDFLAAKAVKMVPHLLFSLDLARAEFLSLLKGKGRAGWLAPR